MSFDLPYELFPLGIIFGTIFLFISLKLYYSKCSGKITLMFFLISLFSFINATWLIAAIDLLNYNTHLSGILSHAIKTSNEFICFDDIKRRFFEYSDSITVPKYNNIYIFFTCLCLIVINSIIILTFFKNKYLKAVFPFLYCVLILLCCIWSWCTVKMTMKPYYLRNYLYIAQTVSKSVNMSLVSKKQETKKILDRNFYMVQKYSRENMQAVDNLLKQLPIQTNHIERENLNTTLRSITLLFNYLLGGAIIFSLVWQRHLILGLCLRRQ